MTETTTAPPGSIETEEELAFLIADVRGYTRFTHEHGDAAAARLAQAFAEVASDAVEACGGRVIEIRGDEALAVFSSAAGAVRAAVDLVAVGAEEREADPELPLNIGVGIDIGAAVPVGNGFRGAALNTAARLCSKAEGGQVLVTSRVIERTVGAPWLRYADRGSAELKGFEAPVDLFEPVVEQPPRPQGAAPRGRVAPTPLPAELERVTPLTGRELELSWLRGLWRQARRGYGRIVVLGGAAASGKTRLVAELAAFAEADADVHYAGAGGAAAALAASALEAAARAQRPTLVVLDDADVLGERVTARLAALRTEIETAPSLVVVCTRDAAVAPELSKLVDGRDAAVRTDCTLGPLDAQEIRELAALYAGADVDDAPLESITRASGALPGRVHELMSEWAEQEAARRLAAAAEWLATEQAQRKATLEFANNVISLKLARLFTADTSTSAPALCPYKGLASFAEDDAEFFFGRERLVGELAARLVGTGLLAVVGASGSGKSSLVAAGLVPSLAAGLLPGSGRWRVHVIRPGEHPLVELQRVKPAPAAPRHVLVVDQFEEVFTTCADADERDQFLAEITERAREDAERLAVVLTIRGDFIDECARYTSLAELISANQVLVGPMAEDELRRAVEFPARRVGFRVERALSDALVREAGAERGALPLLSTALVELWHQRSNGWLRMDAYDRTGGVRGAVARLAEATFEQLRADEQAAARRIMLRFVAGGEGDSVTRRRAAIAEFDVEEDATAAAVLTRLTEDRLLTRDDGMIEVAHEALLREWPRFQQWLAEDAQGQELRQHLTQAARQWEERGRDNGDLYRGTRLSATSDWAATRMDELNELERSFLTTSRHASERSLRRLRIGIAALAVLLLAAIGAGVFALVQRAQARRSARVSLAGSLGAQAVADPRLDQAMLLGVEGVKLDRSEHTEGDLLTAVLRAPTAIRTLQGDGRRVNGMALSPDGRTLALEDNVPNIFFYDTSSGRRVGRVPAKNFTLRSAPSTLVYVPDGRLAALGGANQKEVDLFDRRGAITARLSVPKRVRAAIGPAGPFRPAANVGGNNLALGRGGDLLATEIAGFAVQWNVRRHRLATKPFHVPPGAAVVLYLPGGRRLLAVAPSATTIVDARDGRRVRSFAIGGSVAALSPDGRTAIFGDADGAVSFLDIASGRITTSASAHAGAVQAVGFTRDSKIAITSGEDGKSRIWDAQTHTVTSTLAGHANAIPVQAISADGRTLYTGGVDGNAIEWDLTGKRALARSFSAATTDPSVGAWNVAITPDGRRLAVGATDGTVNIWDTQPVRKATAFRTNGGVVAALSFAPDGKRLLVAMDKPKHKSPLARGSLAIYDLSSKPRVVSRIDDGGPMVTWATFSPDGDRIAATEVTSVAKGPTATDGVVAEWNARTGRLLARPTMLPGGGESIDVTFAKGGGTVAVAQLGDTAAIVDPARRKVLERWRVSHAELALAAALSPDGKRLATGDNDGFLRIWNVSTRKLALPAIRASEFDVASVNWSPDGRWIVTTGGDSTLRLFDARTGEQLGASFPIAGANAPYAVFSSAGSAIAAADASGHVWLYPGSVPGWERYACRLANRNLTRSEWSELVPGRPYTHVCAGPS